MAEDHDESMIGKIAGPGVDLVQDIYTCERCSSLQDATKDDCIVCELIVMIVKLEARVKSIADFLVFEEETNE